MTNASEAKQADDRTLCKILDSIITVAERLDDNSRKSINKDVAEIWSRYCSVPPEIGKDSKLRKAVKILTNEYFRGMNLGYVRNPLAWALYQTWKQFDGKE